MAQLQSQTTRAVGAVDSLPLNLIPQNSFIVGFAVSADSGSINATVQFTEDDPFEDDNVTPSATAVWVNSIYVVGVTVATLGNISAPCRGIRVVNADTGVARLVVNQFV